MSKGREATHAYCPRCVKFEPIIWRATKIWVPKLAAVPGGHALGTEWQFEGFELECRTCKFEITKVGFLTKGEQVA